MADTNNPDIHLRWAWRAAEYCFDQWGIQPQIYMSVVEYNEINCWGYCQPHTFFPGAYIVVIARDQRIRQFIATVCHELVHVRQYSRGKWRGDGEREAERLQYKLADRIWKRGIL